jgi:hypothetical protein
MAKRRARKSAKDTYWLSLEAWSVDFSAAALERYDAEQERLKASKRHDRIQRAWRAYYARTKNGECDTTSVIEAGERGEVLLLRPNRFARLIRDHLTLVQQTPSKPNPIAANTDAASQRQSVIARGIVEHYKRDSNLESLKLARAEVAELCGDSYLHAPWDTDAGREVAADTSAGADGEPVDRVIYEGDYAFSVRSPYEVARDRWSPDPKKPRWCIVKEPVNKYDLLAKVREQVIDPQQLARYERAILAAEPWSKTMDALDYDSDSDQWEYDDSIALYHVYGARSRALPEGRYAQVINSDVEPLYDGPLGEPSIPVFRLSQGEVLFRNEATTPNHDGLPLHDALSAQISTILSNNANFGMQRIISPRAANVDSTQIDSGAATVNYDHVDKAGTPIPAPQPWNVLASNPELYSFYQQLAAELDLVMAGSPVTRGDPRATQGDSGSKVAALFTAAQNVQSSFIGAVLASEAEFYTFLVRSLRHHATVPRIILIAGKANTFSAIEYKDSDLDQIERVQIEDADPMRDTLQGRLALVELLAGQSPEQQRTTLAVLRTGNVEVVTSPADQQRMLIDSENEALLDVTQPIPPVAAGDDHVGHLKSHTGNTANMQARGNREVMQRHDQHCQWHLDALTPSSPSFIGIQMCAATGQTPLPDPNAPPQPPAGMPPSPTEAGQQPQQQGGGGPKLPGPNGQRPTAPGMPQGPDMPNDPIGGGRMERGPGAAV